MSRKYPFVLGALMRNGNELAQMNGFLLADNKSDAIGHHTKWCFSERPGWGLLAVEANEINDAFVAECAAHAAPPVDVGAVVKEAKRQLLEELLAELEEANAVALQEYGEGAGVAVSDMALKMQGRLGNLT